MKLIRFPWQTVVIAEHQDEYHDMPAHRAKDEQGTTITCWKLTWRERFKLLVTGKLWHTMLTFNQAMQPQALSVDDPSEQAAVVCDPVLIEQCGEALDELVSSLPCKSAGMSAAQKSLVSEYGTPRQFARKVVEHVGLIDMTQAQDNIDGYLKLWERSA